MNQKKSFKNFMYGILGFVITTLLGIIIPRLFLLSYGSEVNGLINSVKQIFAYFALLEAGVGGATLQALYGPMARQDKREVSSILSATHSFYKKTGFAYAACVLIMAVVYPFLVKTDIATPVIVCIILFQGEAGVVKYFVTSKLQLLLKVDGKNYILTNISTIFSIFSNFARIALMSLGFDILWVQGVFCLVDICQVLIVVFYTKKYYGWLNLKETPNFQAISQKNDVLVHQLSGLVFNNTDIIILTFFCGLSVVSVYSMYAMLFGLVASVITIASTSVNFAMGQLFHSDRERYAQVQETYETYYLAFSVALFAIAYIFILPFLRLYTEGVSDISYIDPWLPELFVCYQVLNYGRNTSNNIIDYAGHYKQTKWRSALESLINLVVSLICVSQFGIYGVLAGTIVALLYRTNDIILYANRKIMNRSPWPTYRRWLRNAVLLVICGWLGSYLPQQYGGYGTLITTAVVVGVIIVVVFFAINTLMEKQARETAKAYVQLWLRKK